MSVGRYAPSPTGDLHLGNLRTAVVAWLFARHDGGRFLLRIEDLDPASRSGRFDDSQLRDLRSLGVDWDAEPVRQSARLHIYEAAIEQLLEDGLVFECYCSRREVREATRAAHDAGSAPGYPGTCRELDETRRRQRRRERPASLRLRGTSDIVALRDRIAGDFAGPVDDLVIRRNDGTPAYNIAVVVDDADQGIDLVVRGDDLLPATPAQIHLHTLLGTSAPAHAHVPLVLGPTGERLAKRDGAVSLGQLTERGTTPEHVVAWIGNSLGLSEPEESVTIDDLLARFDPEDTTWTEWTVNAEQIGSTES